MVKADCYGLGAEALLPVMMEEGCGSFFVAYPEEAVALRRVATTAIFHVFGAAPGTGPYDAHCRPLFYRAEDLKGWSGGFCGVQIDIGMNRLGIRPEELAGIEPREDVTLVVAHLSDSGNPSSERNNAQRGAFAGAAMNLRTTFPRAKFSLSATGGLMLEGSVAEEAVRPGIALYGGSPGAQDPLEPIATFDARVVSVHHVPEGETVGYNGTWRAARPSVIATLAAGYADGLPRSLANRGTVFLAGRERPIVGAVSMDLLTVDVTETPGIEIGTWAEIFGPNIPVDDVASGAGTIGYELLTGIHGRTRRVYVGE